MIFLSVNALGINILNQCMDNISMYCFSHSFCPHFNSPLILESIYFVFLFLIQSSTIYIISFSIYPPYFFVSSLTKNCLFFWQQFPPQKNADWLKPPVHGFSCRSGKSICACSWVENLSAHFQNRFLNRRTSFLPVLELCHLIRSHLTDLFSTMGGGG